MKKKVLKSIISWITDIFICKDPSVPINKKNK